MSRDRQPERRALPRQGSDAVQAPPEPKTAPLPRTAVTPAAAERAPAPAPVRDALAGPGAAIDPAARAAMEQRFGEDFSAVRIHADASAARAARAVDARAFAGGERVAFAEGRYAPSSPEGEALLAHELAHVVQQRRGSTGDARQAEAAASAVAAGQSADAARLGSAAPGIQRAPNNPAGPSRSLTVELATLDAFALNSAVLTAAHAQRVASLAGELLSWIDRVPGISFTIAGHTDATGGEAMNADLGQRRADAVRDALVKAGVPAARLETTSAGEGALLVPTERAEPRNRRVVVRAKGRPLSLDAPPRPSALPADAPTKPDLAPKPSPTPPAPQLVPPAGVQPRAPGSTMPWRLPTLPPGQEPPAARAGKPGDLWSAIGKIDVVRRGLDNALEDQKRQFDKGTSTGEKVATGATALTIVVPSLAAALNDPDARKLVLGAADGQEIPVPFLKGAKVKILTQSGGGAVFIFDLSTVIKPLK